MTKLNLFDHYGYRARLLPAFLSLVPLAVGAYAWFGIDAKLLTALWSLLGAAGFTFFLSNLARNRGKAMEPKLWQSWGGAPTTQLLRHSGPANAVLRERWHQHLSKLLGRPLPTAEEERAAPLVADEVYEAAIRILISKTYNKTAYPFIYRDNVNYGFCRNLYALRSIGIVCALFSLFASVAAALWLVAISKFDYLPVGCAFVCAFFIMWWILIVNGEWVKVPAMNYAQHLLASTEKLAGAGKKPKAMA